MAATCVQSSALSSSGSFITAKRASRELRAFLWTLQSLLALIFVMTGSMKLSTPSELLGAQSPLPLIVVRFVGLCQLAGALGLILPGLLRIRPTLTPFAAAGLVVPMTCATILTPMLISRDPVLVAVPASVGVVATFVGYARLRLAPIRARS